MIRVRITLAEGFTTEGEFKNFDELTFWILKHSINIRTMEIDVESSDNNRPTFWSQE